MSNGDENRRSFRVNESAYLKYDLLTDEEFESGLAHRKISRGENDDLRARLVEIDARLSETMYRMTAESDTVGKCITLLNDKINLLFDALPGVQQTKADLAQQQLLQCDVGADGIVFPSKQQIEVGAKHRTSVWSRHSAVSSVTQRCLLATTPTLTPSESPWSFTA